MFISCNAEACVQEFIIALCNNHARDAHALMQTDLHPVG